MDYHKVTDNIYLQKEPFNALDVTNGTKRLSVSFATSEYSFGRKVVALL